ncbi:MAG: hypothetical protein D6702_07495 [Planctomycetota bacterium]|nr:MAG: hypothetical protein D6702_07495 [Planctomycetota bacterium]
MKTTAGSQVSRYLYHGWHMIREYDATAGDWLWQEIPMNRGEGMLEHIARDTNDLDGDTNTSEWSAPPLDWTPHWGRQPCNLNTHDQEEAIFHRSHKPRRTPRPPPGAGLPGANWKSPCACFAARAPVGRVAKRTDARGKVWTTEWDTVGRVKRTIDPVGNEVLTADVDPLFGPIRMVQFHSIGSG